jgi:hypothetical protein
MIRVPLALVVLVSLGCGSSEPAKDPAAEQRQQEFLARPPPSKSVEVKNLCETGVRVYIGETPNGVTGDHLVLRGGGTSHFPRRDDGTFTLWLEDEKGFGLAKVHVTKRMSKIEIGLSCKTLHAE